MSKTVLLLVLVIALSVAACIEAWTLLQVSDLQTTRKAICNVVDQSNVGMEQSRSRVSASADRARSLADADRNIATTLSAFGSNPALAALVKDFQEQARLNDGAANALDTQAQAIRAIHLAGC